MKFTKPKKLPEANIQAELYHYLRNEGIRCCLEYHMHCESTGNNLRADIVTVIDDEIGCIVECKSRTFNFGIETTGKQYQQYKSFDIPLFYCMKFTHVKKTLESIIKLHKTGVYDVSEMQTFENEQKIRKIKERKLSRLTKKQRFSENWKLLIDSGLEYQHFSDSHVRVCMKIDFWPSSGKFMQFGSYKSKTGGFKSMVKELNRIH